MFIPSVWMRPERSIDCCELAQSGRGEAGIGTDVSCSRACSHNQSRTLAICASAVVCALRRVILKSPQPSPGRPAGSPTGRQPQGSVCRGSWHRPRHRPSSRCCSVFCVARSPLSVAKQERDPPRCDQMLCVGLGQLCPLCLVLVLFSWGCSNKHPTPGGLKQQELICQGAEASTPWKCRPGHTLSSGPVQVEDPSLPFQLLGASESLGLCLSTPGSDSILMTPPCGLQTSLWGRPGGSVR